MTEASQFAPKGQILVVDDEPNIARLIRMYLDREGFETIVAGSGSEALARMESGKPALVILDIMLDRKSVV